MTSSLRTIIQIFVPSARQFHCRQVAITRRSNNLSPWKCKFIGLNKPRPLSSPFTILIFLISHSVAAINKSWLKTASEKEKLAVAVWVQALLLRVWKTPGSNLGPDIGFLSFFSVPPRKYAHRTSNYYMIHPFHIISKSLFTNNFAILRYNLRHW